MIREIRLSFTQGRCEVCGTEHPLASACPTCGAAAQSDPRVEERQRIASDAVAALENVNQFRGVPRGFDPDVCIRLGDWVDTFMTCCARAGQNEDVRESLAARVRELLQSKADISASSQLRPFLWYWGFISRLHDQLQELARHSFNALSAGDPPTAGIEHTRMQSAFDGVATSVEELNALLERWRQIESASGEQQDPLSTLTALAEVSSRNRSGVSILDGDPEDDSLYTKVTGRSECPVELGVGLRATALQVEMLVDEGRFWHCAARAYRRLTGSESGGKGTFAKLVPLQIWKDDLKAAQLELFESGFELRHLLGVDRARTQTRSLIRFGHIIAERCAPALLSSLLAAYRERPYEELRVRDVGDLLEQARQVRLDGLLDGIDRALRHADAHGSRLFEIVENGVRFTANRREYDFLSFEGLYDRVLTGWESVVAIYVGILCAAAAEGTVAELDPIGALDVSSEDRIRFSLLLAAWRDVRATVSKEHVSVVATVPDARPRFSNVALLAPYLDEQQMVTVEISGSWGRSVWLGPARPLLDYVQRDPDLPDALPILPVLAAWTRDGKPVATATQLRKALATVTLQEVTKAKSFQDRRTVVGAIAASAQAVGDVELSVLLNDIGRQLLRIAGGRGRKRWHGLVDKLSGMAAQEVPSIEP